MELKTSWVVKKIQGGFPQGAAKKFQGGFVKIPVLKFSSTLEFFQFHPGCFPSPPWNFSKPTLEFSAAPSARKSTLESFRRAEPWNIFAAPSARESTLEFFDAPSARKSTLEFFQGFHP